MAGYKINLPFKTGIYVTDLSRVIFNVILFMFKEQVHSWIWYICKIARQSYLLKIVARQSYGLLFYSSIILNQNISSVNHLIEHSFLFPVISLSYSICCWMLFHRILLSLFCCCRYIIALQYVHVNTFSTYLCRFIFVFSFFFTFYANNYILRKGYVQKEV